MSETNQHERRGRNLGKVMWLIMPVWAVLLVELVGGFQYSSGHEIDLRQLRDPLIGVTLVAVVVSPVLVGVAFVVAGIHRAQDGGRAQFSTLLFVLTISLLLSMFSCYWSCGGHPTWTSGYR